MITLNNNEISGVKLGDSDVKLYVGSTEIYTPALIINGYKAVDLGLPSGTLWCTKNVGAENEEDGGLYFQWGNVIGHEVGSGFTFSNGTYENTPGYGLRAQGSNIPANATYDGARYHLGDMWRMPTNEEVLELKANCSFTLQTINGKQGYQVISNINGNRIFLPFGGQFFDSSSLSGVDSYGIFWLSDYVYGWNIYTNEIRDPSMGVDYAGKCGNMIRPVI